MARSHDSGGAAFPAPPFPVVARIRAYIETPQVRDVLKNGALEVNAIYSRENLHARFGGNRYSGIVPSRREGVVLLFHTQEPAQQFYRDGFDDEGVYWYSGEGTFGDMQWTAANRSVRDHAELGLDLLLFERAQRKQGLWRFLNVFEGVGQKHEHRTDKQGKDRTVIIFGLRVVKAGTTRA